MQKKNSTCSEGCLHKTQTQKEIGGGDKNERTPLVVNALYVCITPGDDAVRVPKQKEKERRKNRYQKFYNEGKERKKKQAISRLKSGPVVVYNVWYSRSRQKLSFQVAVYSFS